jgi:hypothetical protein
MAGEPKRAWNTCPCGQLVDLPDPCFDGTEVRCLNTKCRRQLVVVELVGRHPMFRLDVVDVHRG